MGLASSTSQRFNRRCRVATLRHILTTSSATPGDGIEFQVSARRAMNAAVTTFTSWTSTTYDVLASAVLNLQCLLVCVCISALMLPP